MSNESANSGYIYVLATNLKIQRIDRPLCSIQGKRRRMLGNLRTQPELFKF